VEQLPKHPSTLIEDINTMRRKKGDFSSPPEIAAAIALTKPFSP